MNKEMLNPRIWLAVIAIIMIAGVMILSGRANRSSDYAYTVNVKGNPSAAIELIEYSDFECPACAVYASVVKELLDTYGDRIRFEYRHYPLRQHLNSKAAAYAAEAAGKQGKFFEMHDKLFARQREWPKNLSPKTFFEEYARSLGLDMERFRQDYESWEVKEKVKTDQSLGNEAGVNGTPTFILNGKKIQNPRNLDEFKQLIEARINKQ